jgi:tRNA U34 5-methylaminomethyl-2-thiouridine-forming methyltransferase MnmC
MNTPLKLKATDDGSYTFFSPDFGESYHSQSGAKEEAEKKFVEPSYLLEKAKFSTELSILDICYGLGYNSAAALSGIWSINPDCKINLIALESDNNVPRQAIKYHLLNQWEKPISSILTDLAFNYQVKTDKFNGQLFISDARITIQQIQNTIKVDAIFLDPFSPPKCPQLWTVDFLKCAAHCLKSDGYLITYSSAASVRVALQLAGLNIGSTASVGRKSPGTIASFNNCFLLPLSLEEKEHLNTRAAIPYRDSTLNSSKEIILEKRQQEQANSSLESSSQWRKRWHGQHLLT